MNWQMSLSQMVAVMLTGMVVVFIALIILIFIITMLGKVFDNINNKKKNEVVPTKATTPTPVKSTPTPKAEPIKAIAQSSEDEDEIIAVISSAVAMMSLTDGKNYRVKSVKAIKGVTSGRPAWSMAGLRENTRPFRH
ncbi:MAG: OadG family transporter subunit [Oscillospiraceae bacterium]